MTDRQASRRLALAADAADPAATAERARKRPTINDIARLANVSKKTVSRVINDSPFVREETREAINAIIKDLGFTPDPQARGLAFRRAFLIGFIYDNPNPQYIVNAQQGILDGLKGSPFELVIRRSNRRNPGFLLEVRTFVERQKLSGVVLFPPLSEHQALAELLEELDCPYVRIASVALDTPERMVVTHDRLGGVQAARHLAGFGHKVIAHISGPLSFRSSHERGRGFQEALREGGVGLAPEYLVEGGYTFESGVAAGEALLQLRPRPTAIFAGNDEMALGVYWAARNAGLSVPGDLSVVGFDDSPMASRVWPPLTTVRLPIRDMGRIAGRMLLVAAGRAKPEEQTLAEPLLVVRDSVAAPSG